MPCHPDRVRRAYAMDFEPESAGVRDDSYEAFLVRARRVMERCICGVAMDQPHNPGCYRGALEAEHES